VIVVLHLRVGVLNADSAMSGFVEELLQKAVIELQESIKPGGDIFKCQSLLRFIAHLIPCGVVTSDSVCNILDQIVDVAQNVAVGDKETWQPYTDHLVCLVLGTLPFAGAEFFVQAETRVYSLINKSETYVESRPISRFENLRPFIGMDEEDDLSLSDCGASDSLLELFAAITEMLEKKQFSLECVPKVYENFENDLGSNVDKVNLRPISFSLDDMVKSIQPVQVLAWYPPKGIIRLMKREHTLGDRLLIERIIAEDYFLHTIHFFEGDRVECAKRLARIMPLNYQYEILLCETIFGQMLRLPNSEFKTIMYGTLMVDLCKLIPTFPRPMSACVRECFARMSRIDRCLSQRLAEWLAYHVSNYNFAWPWERWSHVLEAPESDYQRRFCVDVICRMMRLSYWDRVNQVLPEDFRKLLPVKPHHQPLPESNLGTLEDLEGIWSAKALDLIRKKTSDEQLDEWMKSNALEAVLGGKVNLSKMLLRALLVAGQKSYSHMIIALERYYGPLAVLVSEGGEDAQIAAIETVWQVWSGNSQRAAMAIDRMMTLRLVSANSVVRWVFESGTIKCTGDQKKYNLGWEALFNAVDKTVARVEDVSHDIEMLSSAHNSTDNGTLRAKKELLIECENQRMATFYLAIQNFISVIDVAGSHEENIANLTCIEDIQIDINQPNLVLLYDLVSLAQSFIRHYFKSVSACSEKLSDAFAAAKLPLTKSIMKSFLHL
jgi:nuclear cap-binding protein subunit 1